MASVFSRLTRTALAAALAVSGTVAATALTAPSAHAAPGSPSAAAVTGVAAASAVDGEISRSEVIARARFWLDKGIPYNQGGSYPDQDGRNYRTDCSGYVSMAWHLGTSANTQTLPNYSHEISRSDLKPGDILNSFYDHVILFEKWEDAARTKFSYYSFGSTPVKHVTGVSINASHFDGRPNGDYKALRYNKIIDDAAGRDFTGDGRDDLLGITDAGELRLFATEADLSFRTQLVGPGWATKDLAAAADVNGDGRGDVVAADRVTGDLHLWTGRGNGSFNAAVQIGNGWTNIEQLAAGDFTGDGKGDLVAITKDSANLVLFASTGSGFSASRTLGTSGWGSVKNLAVGDFTGDGKADVVATNETSGQLSLYPSNGSGLNGAAVIGSSFHLKDKLTMADLNKDGTSDIVATDRATGDLAIYASNGSAITDTRKIGDGWSTMTNLL
ncbi:C40 family peptidase [Streptomyces katsurahamanus]|uniref:VCBS repeat-containing protein n=1 Tax=Streptomyces katsurahamanus TaxID=2577098 RepID=A0ABW9NNK8_9ACTN|nr:VCBS repeat-containing protein [Streptomyces katsurahamanus]MQS34890.1 VCBS repeat-containing protein [Streptomyces katsurahamanus]